MEKSGGEDSIGKKRSKGGREKEGKTESRGYKRGELSGSFEYLVVSSTRFTVCVLSCCK